MNNKLENSLDHPRGLTDKEAEALRKKFGKNELIPSSFHLGIFEFLKFFKDPMGLMILALAFTYLLMGEKNDAIIMLIAFIPVSIVDVLLELRAEKALKALKSTFQTTAKVFRDGQLKKIPIQEIVPQDWVVLEEGQTIPADGMIQSHANLSVNESALTGESIPVEKIIKSEVFAGTSILAGRGIFKVGQTGKNTKFGKIVELLRSTDEEKSPLQRKVNHLVAQIFKIAGLLVVVLFVLEWLRGKTFLESLLISLTFGMASVPEEFPLVFTLYLSLGAWRLAKNGVLVKTLPSVETLGSVDVICTDKTGTLTEGKFQLNEIIPFSGHDLDECWKFALLACEPVVVDSMELAIKEKAPAHIVVQSWQLIYDYEFELNGKHMSHAWKNLNGETVLAMKGAIEGVLAHCIDLPEKKRHIIEKTENLSSRGYRLLGLAGKFSAITGIRSQDESNLEFLGILAFSDPIRESAKRAIEICQIEGISVKMITGDHPFTAHAITDQLGLSHSHDALYTGSDLKEMNDDERIKAFRLGSVFSRVTPEQKFELVQSLKSDGKIVAMTGDGVNDAPAMKIADIGISMGENATDAARSTAKMILTKNDFNGIVHAITEGRRIFSNLRKSFSYLISFHVPVVLLSFFPPLFKLGELLMPIHIILLELIVHPVSAFTFENLRNTAPQKGKGIIDKKFGLTSVFSGTLVSLFALMLFGLRDAAPIEEKRTLAVVTVLFGNIGFILLETWPIFTKRLTITIGLLFAVTISIFKIPTFAEYLHFMDLELKWVLLGLFLGLLGSIPSWFIRRRTSTHVV